MNLKPLTLANLQADGACADGLAWIAPLLEAGGPSEADWAAKPFYWGWALSRGYEVPVTAEIARRAPWAALRYALDRLDDDLVAELIALDRLDDALVEEFEDVDRTTVDGQRSEEEVKNRSTQDPFPEEVTNRPRDLRLIAMSGAVRQARHEPSPTWLLVLGVLLGILMCMALSLWREAERAASERHGQLPAANSTGAASAWRSQP